MSDPLNSDNKYFIHSLCLTNPLINELSIIWIIFKSLCHENNNLPAFVSLSCKHYFSNILQLQWVATIRNKLLSFSAAEPFIHKQEMFECSVTETPQVSRLQNLLPFLLGDPMNLQHCNLIFAKTVHSTVLSYVGLFTLAGLALVNQVSKKLPKINYLFGVPYWIITFA